MIGDVRARDDFREMLRDWITPAMRERGLTGGSGKYYLVGASGHLGTVRFSGNPKRSTAEVFEYGISVGVTSTYLRLASELAGNPVKAKPSIWSEMDWVNTAGWGRLHLGEDIEQRALAILAELDHRGLRWLRESLTDEGLRAAVDACPVGVGRGWSRIFLDLAQGHLDAARSSITEARAEHGQDHPVVAELQRRLDLVNDAPSQAAT